MKGTKGRGSGWEGWEGWELDAINGMFKLIKRLLRWALYLFILAAVVMVAAILSLDAIVKQVAQSCFRSETGLEVKIGKMEVGLAAPTIAIEDCKIYYPPAFGGSLFLSVAEIYVAYDWEALRARRIHLKLVRINLAELDVVQDKKGTVNIQRIAGKSGAAMEEVKEKVQRQFSAFTFTGLDTLNVTVQKVRMWNLDSPAQVREEHLGVSNEVFTDLKTQTNFQQTAKMLAGRCTESATPKTNPPFDMSKLLQELLPPGTKI
jgi:hypothetical protein